MHACQLCDRGLDDEGYLCLVCTRATVVRLDSLPALYRALALLLPPPGSGGASGERRSSPVHAPLPVNEDVLDLRSRGGIEAAVSGWLAAVDRDRGVIGSRSLPQGPEARLTASVAGLIANMPWVSLSWPDAGAFAEDIRQLTRSISSMLLPASPREQGQRLGHCPAQHTDGTLCGATLRLAPGETVVRCAWCGSSYPPASWAGLKVLIDADACA